VEFESAGFAMWFCFQSPTLLVGTGRYHEMVEALYPSPILLRPHCQKGNYESADI